MSIERKQIEICNAHLPSPAIAVENPDRFLELFTRNHENRARTITDLGAHFQDDPRARTRILAGDLNTQRFEPLYRKLRTRWVDLHLEVGRGGGYNFPHGAGYPFPFLTPNYILIQGVAQPLNMQVIPGGSSDHLAVVGTFRM